MSRITPYLVWVAPIVAAVILLQTLYREFTCSYPLVGGTPSTSLFSRGAKQPFNLV